jgi:hypothetical protein
MQNWLFNVYANYKLFVEAIAYSIKDFSSYFNLILQIKSTSSKTHLQAYERQR